MAKPRPPIHPEDLSTQNHVNVMARYWTLRKIRRYLTSGNNDYPRFLYTYLSSDMNEEWLRSILVDSDIYLSSPDDFNDPFDTSANFIYNATPQTSRIRYQQLIKDRMPGLSRQERRSRLREFQKNPPSREFIQKTFIHHTKNVGLACFTEDPKNILMWSHYAKKHTGLVLQFDLAKDPESLLFALKMHYSDEYPEYDFHKDFNTQFEPILLRKAIQWKYEKEWRILRIGAARTFHPFKPSALTGLIFGCRSSQQYKERIRKILIEREALTSSNISIYQAMLHPSQFKLKIAKCSQTY